MPSIPAAAKPRFATLRALLCGTAGRRELRDWVNTDPVGADSSAKRPAH